jgi:hypothetical protein
MLNIILAIVLGISLTIIYQYCSMAARERLNHGKKIYVNRRKAGNLIPCRYNGVKYYFYINENYEPSKTHYHSKKDAIEACQEEFRSNRPKQTIFTKVA